MGWGDATKMVRYNIVQAHWRMQSAVAYWGEGGELSDGDMRWLAEIRAGVDEMLEGTRPIGDNPGMDAVANAYKRVRE